MSDPQSPFPKGTKPEDTRHIDVSVEIDAPAEEVWPYLSTSAGLSSWYVKADFAEEKAGASCTLDFGAGMVVPAYVQAYDVGQRVRLGPPPDVDSPRVEEYRVEAKAGGKCVVRVVNWGFGEGAMWDAEYEAVKKGWTGFLHLLKRIVERFGRLGYPQRVSLLSFAQDADAAWARLVEDLGLKALEGAKPGDDVRFKPTFADEVRGEVVERSSRGLLLAETTADAGTLFSASIEVAPFGVLVMAGFHFFGEARARAEPVAQKWEAWFHAAFPPPAMPPQ